MTFKLSKKECGTVRSALLHAIDDRESLIEAHAHYFLDGKTTYTDPRYVRTQRALVNRFRKLLAKLSQETR